MCVYVHIQSKNNCLDRMPMPAMADWRTTTLCSLHKGTIPRCKIGDGDRDGSCWITCLVQ